MSKMPETTKTVDTTDKTVPKVNRPKRKFMFQIPIGYMTEDIRKTQSEAISSFMQMRYSVKSGADNDMIEKAIKQFEDKMKAYTDAIVASMKTKK